MRKKVSLESYLEIAMQIEKDGAKFYSSAAKKINEYNSKKLLQFLAGEEKKHLVYLQNVLKSVRSKKSLKIETKAKKPPLFNKAKFKKIEKADTKALEIFNTALGIEKLNHDFYADMAKKVKNKDVKNILKMLAEQELQHKKLIGSHSEALYNLWYWEGLEELRPIES